MSSAFTTNFSNAVRRYEKKIKTVSTIYLDFTWNHETDFFGIGILGTSTIT